MLVNLREGEFIEYTSEDYQVYALRDLKFKRLGMADEVYSTGQTIPTRATYSKLRAEDVQLLPNTNTSWNKRYTTKPNLPAS